MTLRVSTRAAEGVYQGSKYLKYQVLCDREELCRLFDQLSLFWIFLLTGIGKGEAIDRGKFLDMYGNWIEGLKQGRVPTDAELKTVLASAFTAELGALWRQEVPGVGALVKIGQPVVQVQAHFFTYSSIDEVFRPMTMGAKSIFWGLQFSFPQIYQDPKTMEFHEVEESPNALLFQKIKEWVRNETRATPFVASVGDGTKKTNVPIRLGKQCFSWVGKHPQLIEQQIGVYGS